MGYTKRSYPNSPRLISALRVISRNSVMGYREERKPTRQIARELGVSFILEGSARIGGGLVRLTLQLIDGRTDEHLWSEDYDRPYSVEGFIPIQGEVALEVASRIKAEISPDEQARIAEIPTDDLLAYEYFIRGNHYFNRSFTEEDFWSALQMYNRAIELDTMFALAYAMRSISEARLDFYGYDRGTPLRSDSERDLDRAASLAPDLPETTLAKGYFHYWTRGEYEEALRAFETVTKVQPSNSEAWAAIGFVQRRQGNFVQASVSLNRASLLDPRSARLAFHQAITALWLRRYSVAEQYYDQAIALSPEVSTWYQGNREGKAEALLLWDGTTTRPRSVVEEAQLKTELRTSSFNYFAFVLDVMDRRYQEARDRLDSAPSPLAAFEQDFLAPKDLLRAQLNLLMGQDERAKVHFELATRVLQSLLEEDPDEYRFHSSLGLCYAGLGDKTRAIAEVQRGEWWIWLHSAWTPFKVPSRSWTLLRSIGMMWSTEINFSNTLI